MFRKRRSSINPPVEPGVTPSATSAAAMAFLNKRASDASLSASAAAAALRSHTTSPQPVGAVQTKRMIRRGSVTSVEGSPVGSLRQPLNGGVQRSASSASMRERSFRSPSPGGRKAPTPLPTLHDEVPPLPQSLHTRNRSNDTTASATAGRSATPSTINTNATTTGFTERRMTVKYDPHTRTVVRVPVDNRIQSGNPGSPRSVNFSRPMSPPVSYNSSAREQVRPRPASALGHSTLNSSRNQPPMPAGASQIAALRQQANKAQVPPAVTPTARQRPGSSAGAPAGALVAASVAARPTSTSVMPGTAPASANTGTRPVAARPTSAASVTRPPAESKTRAVSSPMALTGASVSTVSATSAASKERAPTGPSQQEIANFQTRAASMLARPLTDTAAMPSAEADATPVQSGLPPASQISGASVAATSKPEQPTLGSKGAPPARTTSVSPSRMAHFSQLPVVENLKHQPPPRDLSPAKSALKAPSPRPSSPAGSRISETSSVHSDDGITPSQKKKRGVRVSFDENAVLVGEASSPMTPASNTIMSPQYKKDTVEPWSSEDDGTYAPRPALPSFGSVRDRKSPPLEKNDLPVERSSEALSQASEQGFTTQNVVLTGYKNKELAERVLNNSTGTETMAEPVPYISVLPATPRIDESKNLDTLATTGANAQREAPLGGIAEPEITAMHTAADAPEQSAVSDLTIKNIVQSGQFDSEDTFSDAAEDPSQLNVDGGTQSLDAIIESPSAEASLQPPLDVRPKEIPTAQEATAYAVTAADAVEGAPPTTETDDWERIRRYWNSLSEQRKQELESEASKNATTSEFAPASPPTDISATNGAGSTATTRSTGAAPLPPWPDKQYQTSVSATSPPMKQTMRASHQRIGSEPTHMRTSMREVAQPAAASKERVPPPKSAKRPTSAQVAVPASTTSATAIGPLQAATNAAKPKLERTLSNESSASESSFRRKRGLSVASSEGAGYTMRRTMRGAPQPDASQATLPKQQKSDRSNIPAMPPSSKKGMHGSLRNSVDSTASTMRSTNQQASKQRNSKLGFGKSSKVGSRFKSRFNDSSDEDEDPKSRFGFRSRFDDSDDEAEAPSGQLGSSTKLTPVRGIPKKAGRASGDSTDLDDSDDAGATPNIASFVASKPKPTPQPAVQAESLKTPANANGATEGTALKTGTLRTEKPEASSSGASPQASKTKRGFLGLGRKKQAATEDSASQPASPMATTSSPKVTNISTVDTTTTASNIATQQAPASPASPTSPTNRRSRFLRRLSTSEDVVAKDASTTSATGSTAPQVPPIPLIPTSFSSYMENSPSTPEERPNTTEAVAPITIPKTLRPTLGEKRESSMTAPQPETQQTADRHQIYSERTGKKKKFQGLRRMLGVHN